ncbi:HPP family protein [Pseudodesulfovibrio indicus]|uniref:HPP family protein n=1 Tax=Pseudodesulfovibrio indicus TaxID=1716143 RepID=A0A126QLK8_9BACT|nr:HPP family protein [Pseudodesulfovibrio indicus]AMK10791.1 hypothetical protein AWY79_06545 [Pseudodesulfovibrio indicus]TDT91778.1 HPP family protein [Pseudodesulfovibrio indicus]
MLFKSGSVQFRLASLCREEFAPEVYRPGVISLSRLLWGSLGGGLLLAVIALASRLTGIAVLFPPLAATCFINSTCVFLRVARPKPVIVGHFVASIGGLAGCWVGSLLGAQIGYAVALKLGFAVMFAAVLMQIFDADHPPAAATAAIPAILPLPMPAYLLPVHMAWGATLAVLFAMVWNRLWFEFPAADIDHRERACGLYMQLPQIAGLAVCAAGFALLCLQRLLPAAHTAGTAVMLLGVALLGTHHFFGIRRAT